MPKYCTFKCQNSSCSKQKFFGVLNAKKVAFKVQKIAFKCQFQRYKKPKLIYEIDPLMNCLWWFGISDSF